MDRRRWRRDALSKAIYFFSDFFMKEERREERKRNTIPFSLSQHTDKKSEPKHVTATSTQVGLDVGMKEWTGRDGELSL